MVKSLLVPESEFTDQQISNIHTLERECFGDVDPNARAFSYM